MLENTDRREQRDLELLRRVHDRTDLHAREELVVRFMPLVYSIARQYRSSGEPFEDIVQSGSLGLVKAIDRFDAGLGSRFVSFAVPNIQGEIRRHFRDHTWAVHVPRGMQELSVRVRQCQSEILDRSGHLPTVEQVALRIGEAPERVAEAINAADAYDALSLDQPIDEGRNHHDLSGGTDPGYAAVDDRSAVRDAFRVLDERIRRVVTERFYEDRLQREIAEDIGVSQMQVSRLIRQGLGQMRRYLDDGSPASRAV